MDIQTNNHSLVDRYITALSVGDGILAQFVQCYPGSLAAQADSSWLDEWFFQRAQHFYQNPSDVTPRQADVPEALGNAISAAEGFIHNPFKILDIQPHFFRGFRALESPISLSDGLVVIDGPNSSGKTSLAEAFEWLFTGNLIRREIQGQGASRELENCICNQLRPDGELTWVEATLQTQSGETIRLRRVLGTDYGPASTSKPSSVLAVNGNELSSQDEIALLDTLALGLPPILMQHTLRLFVQSSPAQRRDYFERLLRLDELTFLVEQAVVGDASLPRFQRPGGGVSFAKWNALKEACTQRTSRSTMSHLERSLPEDSAASLSSAILAVGKGEFLDLLGATTTMDEAITLVRSKQRIERQESFPILEALRPLRAVDDQLNQLLDPQQIKEQLEALCEAISSYEATQQGVNKISDAHLAISAAFDALERAGVIMSTEEAQTCPLCAYEISPTLTADRIGSIRSWAPAREAFSKMEAEILDRAFALLQISSMITDVEPALIPSNPTDELWEASLKTSPASISGPATELRSRTAKVTARLSALNTSCQALNDSLSSPQPNKIQISKTAEAIDVIIREAPNLILGANEYATAFTVLDNAVGALSSEDPAYNLRAVWLDVASDQANLLLDLSWELAKKKAQAELEVLRAALIRARQTILDARRNQFNDGMTEIWQTLREDRYSAFNRLFVPEPRGRGFPIEIEVKAILDDNVRQVEVDALRVFSESQVHALGIAAFLTRANLLGHRCIILDDPVQSMDEEHFLTFASHLLPHLLENGLQVILLTHNDLFSRDVSHVFANTENYTTLRIRHARRTGCQVEEGNRRAEERLKKAQALAEGGQLEDAWRLVRVAVERIYLCTMIKHGPREFDPRSWSSQTADYMWETGVGEIFQRYIPDIGDRPKEILQMAVAGAHDKAPRGQTDLIEAVSDLRRYMQALKLGPA